MTTTTITMERNNSITKARAEEILHSKLLPGWGKQTNEVIDSINTTSASLQDLMAKRSAFLWNIEHSPFHEHRSVNTLVVELAGKIFSVHSNALEQAAQLANIPFSYVDLLHRNDPELLAHNLNKRFSSSPNTQQLVRCVRNETRAILSNRYKRIDCRPMMEAVTGAAKNHGLVPMGGKASDLRHHLRLAMPRVFEPVPGEFVMFGLNWSSSDFGRGAQNISDFFLRVFCNNGAVTETHMHQVHLGSRIEADDGILSPLTLALETEASLSAAVDVINDRMDPKRIEERIEIVRLAAEKNLTPGGVDAFLKKYLKKEQVKLAKEAFLSPDVEMLPPGNNVWRLSNTLSWLANNETDREQSLDYQELAGKVLLLAAA